MVKGGLGAACEAFILSCLEFLENDFCLVPPAPVPCVLGLYYAERIPDSDDLRIMADVSSTLRCSVNYSAN